MDRTVVAPIVSALEREGIAQNPAHAFAFKVEEIRREQTVVVRYASLKMRSLLTILARQLTLSDILEVMSGGIPEEYVLRRRHETLEEAITRAQEKYGAKLLEYLEVVRIFL